MDRTGSMQRNRILILIAVLICALAPVSARAAGERMQYPGEGVVQSTRGELSAAAYLDELELSFWDDSDGFLVLNEQAMWRINARGGDGKYLYSFRLFYRAPDAQTAYYEMVSALDYSPINLFPFTPENAGTYFMALSVMDESGSVLTYSTHPYSTSVASDESDPATLPGKVLQVARACEREAGTSEYARALFLHDWLVNNANYDYTYSRVMPEDVLLNGSGVCQSYATAYNLLLRAVGINSLYISGYGNGGPHAWNLVCLDGDWYHVDCTWDDPNTGGYERRTYFGLTDEEIGKDHTWNIEEDGLYPACVSEKYQYKTRVAAFAMDESAVTLPVSGTYRATVSTMYEPGGGAVSWSVADETVATVDDQGVVTGVSAGDTVLTAKNAAGDAATCLLTVSTLPVGVDIEYSLVSLVLGTGDANDAGLALTARVDNAGTEFSSVTWTCSDPSVAVISEDGHIQAVGVGYAVVTAETVNGLTDMCQVKVSEFVTVNEFTAFLIPEGATILGWTRETSYNAPAALNIPETINGYPVIVIDANAFQDESFLSIHLPSTLQTIGTQAFYGSRCTSALAIPASVLSIGDYALAYMWDLPGITADARNPQYASADGVLYANDFSALICYPMGKAGDTYTVPSSVEILPNFAFYRTQIQTLCVPSATVYADSHTFWGCELTVAGVTDGALHKQIQQGGLEGTLTFAPLDTGGYPTGISLSENALALCANSPNANEYASRLTASLTPGGANAGVFWASDDERVAVTDNFGNVTAVGAGECDITVMTVNGLSAACRVTVTEIPSSVVLSDTALTLYCAEGTGGTFSYPLTATVTPEGNRASLSSSDSGVVAIWNGRLWATGAGSAFITATDLYGKTAVCTVTVEPISVATMPDSLTAVRDSAFAGDAGLTCVYIPGSACVSIGENAFQNCANLKLINLPGSVAEIGAGAFAGCPDVTIYCPEGGKAHEYASENGIRFVLTE